MARTLSDPFSHVHLWTLAKSRSNLYSPSVVYLYRVPSYVSVVFIIILHHSSNDEHSSHRELYTFKRYLLPFPFHFCLFCLSSSLTNFYSFLSTRFAISANHATRGFLRSTLALLFTHLYRASSLIPRGFSPSSNIVTRCSHDPCDSCEVVSINGVTENAVAMPLKFN